MLAYIKAKQEEGKIDTKKLAKFKKDAKAVNESDESPIKKSHEVRNLFAAAFMPELLPKKKSSFDFFAELDKI